MPLRSRASTFDPRRRVCSLGGGPLRRPPHLHPKSQVIVVDQITGALAPTGAPRNNCLLPASQVYDPVTNPNGTRCGQPDLAVAVWGTTAGIPAETEGLLPQEDLDDAVNAVDCTILPHGECLDCGIVLRCRASSLCMVGQNT